MKIISSADMVGTVELSRDYPEFNWFHENVERLAVEVQDAERPALPGAATILRAALAAYAERRLKEDEELTLNDVMREFWG